MYASQLIPIARPFAIELAPGALACAPGLASAFIRVRGLRNLPSSPPIEALLRAAERDVVAAGLTRASIGELAPIAAWRAAYARFGARPSRSPCAAESLLRRVASEGRLPRINALVDLCNAASLRSQIPIAACDIAGASGGLSIRPASGAEQYLPLGAPEQPERPEPGEIIYADAAGRAHSRRWNWRQSDLIKVTAASSEAILTIEAAHAGGPALVERTVAQLLEYVRPLAAGAVDYIFLDERRPDHLFS